MRMIGGQEFLNWLVPLFAVLHRVVSLNSVSAVCDFSFVDGNKIYNYTLTSPVRDFPHGVLSEDGCAFRSLYCLFPDLGITLNLLSPICLALLFT